MTARSLRAHTEREHRGGKRNLITRQQGFTILELVLIIIIVGILGALATARYLSLTKAAEQASVNSVIASLSSALNIYSAKQITSSQTITAHNPFDDLSVVPSNYTGTYGDVNDTNCQPGQWAYQSGNPSNGNWAVVVYRPQSTLTQAFTWNNIQWIVLVVNTVQNANGTSVGLVLDYYPPSPVW